MPIIWSDPALCPRGLLSASWGATMRKALLGSIIALVLGNGLTSGDEPEVTVLAAEAGPSSPDSPPSPARPPPGPGPLGAGPWNPDVRHANAWPYDAPLVIPTEEYGPPGEFWARMEYVLWQVKPSAPPPLATAGPAQSGGVLGQPGVRVLFGGSDPDFDPFSGGRITWGLWLDECYRLGFEGDCFFLGRQSVRFDAASAGETVLAVPFIN